MKHVRSLERALAVLESFTEDQRRLGLSELSRKLRVSKATLLRILRTLEAHEIVRQRADDRSFVLGPCIIRLGTLALRDSGLLEVGLSHIKRLQALTGETVCLFIVSGTHRVCVATMPSQHDLRMTVDVGATRPLYAGAAGKVLLAFMPEEEVRRVLAGERLQRLTEKTVTTASAVLRELEGIRRACVAISYGEFVPGGAAIAAPIFGPEESLIAAVNLLGPQSRMTAEVIQRFTPAVIATARAISSELGWKASASAPTEPSADEGVPDLLSTGGAARGLPSTTSSETAHGEFS